MSKHHKIQKLKNMRTTGGFWSTKKLLYRCVKNHCKDFLNIGALSTLLYYISIFKKYKQNLVGINTKAELLTNAAVATQIPHALASISLPPHTPTSLPGSWFRSTPFQPGIFISPSMSLHYLLRT